MRLAGKVALVVGATRGIGREIAATLAREGARVVLVGRTAHAGEEAAAEINRAAGGERAVFVAGDASREETAVAAVLAATERFGRLDVLVNNAGVDLQRPLAETSLDEWNRCLAVDLGSAFLACKHAIPAMIETGGGSIVSIASTAAIRGVMQHSAYGAAKAGLVNLMRNVVVDYGRRGIRANCICPGAIDTPMLQEWIASQGERAGQVAEQLRARIPAGRFGRAAEVANAVLFLASDESSFVSGNVILVDGGSSA
jgi:NAD(P)-dependent dehydrogenase (short-subunit alcohol dehydrogenase family)